jgi:hypothetical protein
MDEIIAEFDITYAYNQFSIFDESAGPCPVAWTEQHCRQGFCRSSSAAGFMTLDQWGIGHVKVRQVPFNDYSHLLRLIKVPFFAESGRIAIQGPEDPPPLLFSVGTGHYLLWVGQSLITDGEEEVEVYFESVNTPMERSDIVIKDELLEPDSALLEE